MEESFSTLVFIVFPLSPVNCVSTEYLGKKLISDGLIFSSLYAKHRLAMYMGDTICKVEIEKRVKGKSVWGCGVERVK